jgi:hypothetical protein
MNTQNPSDTNKSNPSYEKKRDTVPPMPGKGAGHGTHEQEKSREGKPNEDKGASNKGEHSTGWRQD